MDAGSSKYGPAEARSEIRCAHCGRLVKETIHTRSDYQVDYYELHTGAVEPTTIRRGEDGPAEVYLRLLTAELVITCADCYRDPAVRAERERRYRPEDAQSVGEMSA